MQKIEKYSNSIDHLSKGKVPIPPQRADLYEVVHLRLAVADILQQPNCLVKHVIGREHASAVTRLAGLNPLGDGNFFLSRKEGDAPHLHQVHANRVIRHRARTIGAFLFRDLALAVLFWFVLGRGLRKDVPGPVDSRLYLLWMRRSGGHGLPPGERKEWEGDLLSSLEVHFRCRKEAGFPKVLQTSLLQRLTACRLGPPLDRDVAKSKHLKHISNMVVPGGIVPGHVGKPARSSRTCSWNWGEM